LEALYPVFERHFAERMDMQHLLREAVEAVVTWHNDVDPMNLGSRSFMLPDKKAGKGTQYTEMATLYGNLPVENTQNKLSYMLRYRGERYETFSWVTKTQKQFKPVFIHGTPGRGRQPGRSLSSAATREGYCVARAVVDLLCGFSHVEWKEDFDWSTVVAVTNDPSCRRVRAVDKEVDKKVKKQMDKQVKKQVKKQALPMGEMDEDEVITLDSDEEGVGNELDSDEKGLGNERVGKKRKASIVAAEALRQGGRNAEKASTQSSRSKQGGAKSAKRRKVDAESKTKRPPETSAAIRGRLLQLAKQLDELEETAHGAATLEKVQQNVLYIQALQELHEVVGSTLQAELEAMCHRNHS
jgi:hypothetical protein